MPYTKPLRKAIAMIELIFAIVIMGIALLSVPNLLLQSSQSSLVTLQQESIAMAASHTNALMTYAWDENNTDNIATYIANKLHVDAGDPRLDEVNITNLPLLFKDARQRKFKGLGRASAISNDGGIYNDIDDFNDINTSIIKAVTLGASNTADIGEYVDMNISEHTKVKYGNDTASYDSATGVFAFSNPWSLAAPGGTSNIKLIETHLTSNAGVAELQKDIKLRAFMCNIGANKPRTTGGF